MTWKECQECHVVMAGPWVYCPFCGNVSEFVFEHERCTNCGYFVSTEWWFCPGCGEDWQVFSGSDPNVITEEDEDECESDLVVQG